MSLIEKYEKIVHQFVKAQSFLILRGILGPTGELPSAFRSWTGAFALSFTVAMHVAELLEHSAPRRYWLRVRVCCILTRHP